MGGKIQNCLQLHYSLYLQKYKYDKSRIYSLAADEATTVEAAKERVDRSAAAFKDPRLAKLWNEVRDDRAFSLKELDGKIIYFKTS